MKRLLFLLCLIGVGFFAKAQQTNPFPSTDSLERFINRWIRNSAVEAFQNLRLNTAMIGMLRFVQNSGIGSGLDTAYALNDSTIRLITFEPDTFDITIRGATGGSSGNLTTIVRRPIIVFEGDSASGIPDTLDFDFGYGLMRDVDSTLVIDSTKYSTVKGTLDTAINVLTRGIVVVDTIQLVHSGISVTTYQNDKLIGSKLLYVSIESYPVGFLTRSNSVYMTFDPGTGTITFTNGRLYDDDMIYILYRTGAIFVTDGSGNLIIDSNGNYVIEN